MHLLLFLIANCAVNARFLDSLNFRQLNGKIQSITNDSDEREIQVIKKCELWTFYETKYTKEFDKDFFMAPLKALGRAKILNDSVDMYEANYVEKSTARHFMMLRIIHGNNVVMVTYSNECSGLVSIDRTKTELAKVKFRN